MTHLLVEFTFQIAVILLVAKIFGELFERLGQSSVLGELIAGMVIGPYALGSLNLPFFGQRFPGTLYFCPDWGGYLAVFGRFGNRRQNVHEIRLESLGRGCRRSYFAFFSR